MYIYAGLLSWAETKRDWGDANTVGDWGTAPGYDLQIFVKKLYCFYIIGIYLKYLSEIISL